MSVGDLSPEQSAYVSAVAGGTGLNATVVTAWVGAESGWNVTKPGHNYLNIGPGMSFPSVQLAAAKVVSLITSSSNYAGIRAAIPAGPAAQIKAIKASPWDAGHYSSGALDRIYTQLAAGVSNAVLTSTSTGDATGTLAGLPSPSDLIGNIAGGIVKPLLDAALPIGLGIVFTAAALGLIALGLYELTGRSPAERFQNAQGLVGNVGQAAKLAAVAAV